MNELLSTIKALEMELHHSGVCCDQARVEEILHPDFCEVGRSGVMYERSKVVSVLGSQKEAPASISDQFELQKINPETVLLTFRSARVNDDGSLKDHALRSSVWLYTNEKWQLRYHQATPAAEVW